MKAQQKKIRLELQTDLDKLEIGIAEADKALLDKQSEVTAIARVRKDLKSKAYLIRSKLKCDYIELGVTDHAIIQYLRRVRPDLLKLVSDELLADKTIERKKSGDAITTVYKK